jgi:hypothetical protein
MEFRGANGGVECPFGRISTRSRGSRILDRGAGEFYKLIGDLKFAVLWT